MLRSEIKTLDQLFEALDDDTTAALEELHCARRRIDIALRNVRCICDDARNPDFDIDDAYRHVCEDIIEALNHAAQAEIHIESSKEARSDFSVAQIMNRASVTQ